MEIHVLSHKTMYALRVENTIASIHNERHDKDAFITTFLF